MRVAQAYRFELNPNDVTAGGIASHVGADRFAFNWGLALVKARLGERARVLEQALVEGLSAREGEALANTVVVPWTLAALRREWNRAKVDVAPWWAENSKEAYSSGLDRL
ncbi:MAG: helix-turn-helix domain-containing protein, partial [Acidimicrobiales bacterium]